MPRTLAVAGLLAATYAPLAAQTDLGPDLGPPVRMMVLGDASYLMTEQEADEGFSLGQVVGHLNAALSERLTVTAEGTLTSRSSGTVATLERLIVRYDVSDAFRLSAGRYHTPIAWWNTHYHHGLWLQASIERPRLVRFGTPLIPVHFMGVLAEGTVPVGRSTVAYEAGVGNGRQSDLVAPGDAGDDNGSTAVVAGLRFRPALVHGLELGVHGYVDEVDTGLGPVDERIVGGHLVWLSNPELMVELLRFIHEPEAAGAGTTTSDGLYAQAGWRPPAAPSLQPYVRYESISVDDDDALFSELGLEYEAIIGGLRWDFTDFAALKSEVRSEEIAGGKRTLSLALNVAFVIANVLE